MSLANGKSGTDPRPKCASCGGRHGRSGASWLWRRAASGLYLAGDFARRRAGIAAIAGASDGWAEFCPRVIQCVTAAGFTPGGPAPGSGLVPTGYTGPQVVFGVGGVAPALIQNQSATGQQTLTMLQPAEQQAGDLLVFVVNYDAGTLALTSSVGVAGTQVSQHSYSNGKFALWTKPFASGDTSPVFNAGSGNHVWWSLGFIVRKASAATAVLDKQYLDNATNVQNWNVTLASAVTLPTQGQSLYLAYGTVFAAASAAANNRFVGPISGLGPNATVGSGLDSASAWSWYPVMLNTQGIPLFALVSYRVPIDTPPEIDVGYLGANGGAGNQPFGLANWS